jgi:branched-chain amino acid transport system ATP-binding protein
LSIACDGLVVKYGGALALDGVTIDFPAGRLSAVVGRNGAGKSTLLMALAGVLRPSAGSVRHGGPAAGAEAGRKKPPSRRVVPESGNVFADLTVLDNLRSGVPMVRPRIAQERVEWALAEFPILARLADRKAGDLSGGERQSLAVARAALSFPSVLLVDEPSLGLAPKAAADLVRALGALSKRSNMTIVVAEQNWRVASSAAFLVHLEVGRVRAAGPPATITPRLMADRHAVPSAELPGENDTSPEQPMPAES